MGWGKLSLPGWWKKGGVTALLLCKCAVYIGLPEESSSLAALSSYQQVIPGSAKTWEEGAQPVSPPRSLALQEEARLICFWGNEDATHSLQL